MVQAKTMKYDIVVTKSIVYALKSIFNKKYKFKN